MLFHENLGSFSLNFGSGRVAGARLRGEDTCHGVVVASSSNWKIPYFLMTLMGFVISGKWNHGREGEWLLLMKLIKWSIKHFAVKIDAPTNNHDYQIIITVYLTSSLSKIKYPI